MTINIFAPGLTLGSANLPYEPAKAYAYVEDPGKWRVYLRAAAFIHPASKSFKADKFIVVKKRGRRHGRVWEPPKGQLEDKDLVPDATIMQLLEANMRREVEEEAKLTNLLNVRHTGLVFQGVEPDFPPNTYFQYHIFQAFIEPDEFTAATTIFSNGLDPALPADQREKDAIDWYRKDLGLYGRWAPGLVNLYLRAHI
jgi:ADP-ribose pyrophosphatase YjhB (NUDIX family)